MSESPTIEFIARKAGVAKSTVSLALRNSPKLLEETRLRIQEIARELGYKPNPLVSAQMAHIRSHKSHKSVTTIGFLNTWYDEASKERLKWEIMCRFHDGVKERADALGFHFEPLEFDTTVYGAKRIEQILEARNIDALVLSPLKRSNTRLDINWDPFAVVSIGYFATFGNIHRVFYDNFNCMQTVMTIARGRGYRRIGFITNQETEERAGHLWSAGFLEFQSRVIPAEEQVSLLRLNTQEAEFSSEEYEQIDRWYRDHQPDLIVSYLDKTLHYLESIGFRSPEDFGYISLLWSKEMGNISGYSQDLEKVGAIAVNIVVDRLLKNNRGVPDYPSSTLLTGEFKEGRTIRPLKER
ncbi:MAG: LacI family DNA-binding transcriptional regulator [Opitutaceae bacterium]|nr:LacI family DNA-binding transcriptional regulator [Opitutaceae bacterium]